MPIIRDAEVRFQERPPGVRMRQIVNEAAGAGAIILGEAVMWPGTSLNLHTHNVEEVIYIAEGSAEGVLGDEKSSLKAGDTILAPAGVAHKVQNSGQKIMRFMFCFPTCQVQTEVIDD